MAKAAAKIVKDAPVTDARNESDTIQLWEGYRERAQFWRSMFFAELLVTVLALGFSMLIWSSRSVTLNVPAKPLPGSYDAYQIPDELWIEKAQDFLNLVATYQPGVARDQFNEARKMLKEPFLTKFDQEMGEVELKAIENTRRTQIFFIDPTKLKVSREGKSVIVKMQGERMKMVAGGEMPNAKVRFIITLGTIPANPLNPYGIMITDVKSELIKS